MGDNRPIGYREDGKSIYRASGFGGCLTSIVAAMAGELEDRAGWAEKILMDAAGEGNLHEADILARLKSEFKCRVWGGQDVDGQDQDEINFEIMKGVILRGHPDGFGRLPRGRIDHVVEAKTMSANVWKKWGAYPNFEEALLGGEFTKYAWQISIYMHHYKMPAIYAIKNRNSGEMIMQVLKAPPISLKEIKAKAIQAEKWRAKGEYPVCGASAGDKTFCPFPQLHDSEFGTEDDDDFEPVDSVTAAQILGMLDRRAELTLEIQAGSRADDERKDLNKQIIELMPGNEYSIKGYKAKIQNGATQPKLNASQLFTELQKYDLNCSVEELKAAIKASSFPFEYTYLRVYGKREQ